MPLPNDFCSSLEAYLTSFNLEVSHRFQHLVYGLSREEICCATFVWKLQGNVAWCYHNMTQHEALFGVKSISYNLRGEILVWITECRRTIPPVKY